MEMQNDKTNFTKESCKAVTLGELISITGTNPREILIITSSKRYLLLETAFLRTTRTHAYFPIITISLTYLRS